MKFTKEFAKQEKERLDRINTIKLLREFHTEIKKDILTKGYWSTNFSKVLENNFTFFPRDYMTKLSNLYIKRNFIISTRHDTVHFKISI